MYQDVEIKIKKKNEIIFSRDSVCLHDLLELIKLQKHRTLVLWAFDCAEVLLNKIEVKFPNESRPRNAIKACKSWAKGEVKMPHAKRAILDSHQAAKGINDRVIASLCHAVGHAGATVHVETHAIGLPIYELTAIVIECGYKDYQLKVEEKIDYYINRLKYYQENIDKLQIKWAKFLLDDTMPNKENKRNT